MSQPDATDVAVTDDRVHHRFLYTADGLVAHLDYREVRDRIILVHTEVPAAMGGHGVGGLLVRAALARATRDNLTVVPWCSFARRWLKEHAGEAAPVKIDWSPPR